MRLLVIGIDGLDPILLEKWMNELPNLRKIAEGGNKITFQSIYPIDSIPIWASIFTGLTPARHGIIHYMKYFGEEDEFDCIGTKSLQGRTFWDIASEYGKKVSIINPFVAYPSWQVNGVMVSGPIGTNDPPTAFPKSVLENYKIPHLGGVRTKFPVTKKELNKFRKRLEKITLDEVEFGLKILEDYTWDLAFINLITLDGIEHSFWRYCNADDPTYPGKNPFENVIKDFYKLHDEVIGRFIQAHPDAGIIVVSDHGHCMRSIKLVNINEFLRRKGYLSSKEGKTKTVSITEKIKSKLLDIIYKYELYGVALRVTHLMPSTSKKLQKSEFSIDIKKSKAIASDFTGMNPFGGINIISTDNEGDYEELRTLIIKELLEFKDPETNEKLVRWACRREELYSGEYISKYPDVLFELKKEYGVNWAIHTQLITVNYAHKLLSGGHSREATFLIYGVDNKKIVNKNATSTDVAPSILDLLDVKGNFKFDGRSIFRRSG